MHTRERLSTDVPRTRGNALHGFLFRSEPLPEAAWAARHRFIRGLAAVHIALLTTFALVRGMAMKHVLVEMSGLGAVVLLAGLRRFDRRTKEGLGTLAMMISSALLVHISGGSIEAHFHFFVMLAVISLYQSWFPFLLGIGFIVVHHGAFGTLHPEEVYNHPAAINQPWRWAGIHALFVTFASVIYVIQWRLNEMARNDARSLYRTLYEGQRSLVRQLEEAATMKEELVSTVSHELRTPLTAIIGYMEMLQLIDDLPPDDVKRFMQQVSRQAGRLNFLIENLMNYQGVGSSEAGHAEVASLIDEVVAHHSGYPGAELLTFESDVTPGLTAATTDRALRLIVSNLVNNAVKYATPNTTIEVVARGASIDGRPGIELAVSNEGTAIRDEDRGRMFGAFVQLDSSITRSVPGVGLGLHIVGRTVAAYDGTVDVGCADGRITFTVRLPAAPPGSAEHVA